MPLPQAGDRVVAVKTETNEEWFGLLPNGSVVGSSNVFWEKEDDLTTFVSEKRFTAVGGSVLLDSVFCSVVTPPSGDSIVVDMLKNGVDSIWIDPLDRPTIIDLATTSNIAIPDTVALASGDYLVPEIANIGTTIPGAGLIVQLKIHY